VTLTGTMPSEDEGRLNSSCFTSGLQETRR
jgi:hypothetical protein